MKKRILCFGDSLTWCLVPEEKIAPSKRYDTAFRWTHILGSHLGLAFEIFEDGLCGRTTCQLDDFNEALDGTSGLKKALIQNSPLDLVIIMLGTNDTKKQYGCSSEDIALGVANLVKTVVEFNSEVDGPLTDSVATKILVIAPPVIGTLSNPWLEVLFDGAKRKSAAFSKLYEHLSDFYQIEFLDASRVIKIEGGDGIHLSKQNNLDFGLLVQEKVLDILLKK